MSATQTITQAGNAKPDAIGRRSSPKLTTHADTAPRTRAAREARKAREPRTSSAAASRGGFEIDADVAAIATTDVDASASADVETARGERDARGEHDERVEPFPLAPAAREALIRWTRAATSPRRVVTRSLVVLLAASGASNVAIAARLGVSRATVALWKTRFLDGGPEALRNDAPGRGRKRGRDPQLVARILHASAQPPLHGARWTLRDIARRVGASHASVQRVLREHDATATARPAHAVIVAPARAAQAKGITSSRGAHAVGVAPTRAGQASGITSLHGAHAIGGAALRGAQVISETERVPSARGGVATALPLSDASPRIITIRHQCDDVRSRRSIFRKATA
jgi:transposase